MKIIFMGNSLVEGRYGGNFVTEAARLLPDCTIVNAGRSGTTVLNLLDSLEDVLEQEPDGVFILTGGNNAISYSQPDTRRYYQQTHGIPGGVVTPEAFVQAYDSLLMILQASHILTWVGLGVLEHNPTAAVALKRYNALARESARRQRIPVFDLAEKLPTGDLPQRPPLGLRDIQLIGQRMANGWADYEAAQAEGGYRFTFDGLHFTPETARQVGAWVAAFIQQNR